MKSEKHKQHLLAVRLIMEFMESDQSIEGQCYRTSWEWLMPVLEKICRLKFIETIYYPNLRTFGMINNETGGVMVGFNGHQVFEAETLLEATFLAIVDFLDWQSI